MAKVTKKEVPENKISHYHNLEIQFVSAKSGELIKFKLGSVAQFSDSDVEALEAIAALEGGKECTLINTIRSSDKVEKGIADHM